MNSHNYALTSDNERDITFTGTLLGEATSESDNSRWTDLNLYITDGGTYICEEIGRSVLPGEKDFRCVRALKTLDEVLDFFGHGWLAKQLYDNAQLETALSVA